MTTRIGRLVLFFVSILMGIALGLYYGWMLNPVEYLNTTAEILRKDYKADYVLMTAEVFDTQRDVNLAARRLEALGSAAPLRSVQEAILTARELNYSNRDVELLAQLAQALTVWGAPGGGQQP